MLAGIKALTMLKVRHGLLHAPLQGGTGNIYVLVAQPLNIVEQRYPSVATGYIFRQSSIEYGSGDAHIPANNMTSELSHSIKTICPQ
jgi:hypothetical protein